MHHQFSEHHGHPVSLCCGNYGNFTEHQMFCLKCEGFIRNNFRLCVMKEKPQCPHPYSYCVISVRQYWIRELIRIISDISLPCPWSFFWFPRDYTIHGNREAFCKELSWWFIYELWWSAEHAMWEVWMLFSGKAEVLKTKQKRITINFLQTATGMARDWKTECGRLWWDEMMRWDLRRQGWLVQVS